MATIIANNKTNNNKTYNILKKHANTKNLNIISPPNINSSNFSRYS